MFSSRRKGSKFLISLQYNRKGYIASIDYILTRVHIHRHSQRL